MKITVDSSWSTFFKENKKDLKNIIKEISKDDFLPQKELIFRAFEHFNIKKTKLVLLGMDPYPGFSKEDEIEKYYAEGLSFSVNPDIKKLPGSLKNIFKELKDNYPDFEYKNGSLKKWVENENIMLLNTALTVKKGKPNSHTKYWKDFTDKVIKELDKNSNCLFLLMGNNAKQKINIIQNKDRIITCVHPSPLSAHRGFLGSKIFIKINQKLKENKIKEINWGLYEKNKKSGGKNTNFFGLKFEKNTELKDFYDIIEINKNYNKIKFKNDSIMLEVSKNKLLKYMIHNNNLNQDIIIAHGCKSPDEVYISEEKNTIYIIEKKFQKCNGSVCEKIQTGVFKKYHFEKIYPKYKIYYIYCLSKWFKENCPTEIEYLQNNNIKIFFSNTKNYKKNIIDFLTS